MLYQVVRFRDSLVYCRGGQDSVCICKDGVCVISSPAHTQSASNGIKQESKNETNLAGLLGSFVIASFWIVLDHMSSNQVLSNVLPYFLHRFFYTTKDRFLQGFPERATSEVVKMIYGFADRHSLSSARHHAQLKYRFPLVQGIFRLLPL